MTTNQLTILILLIIMLLLFLWGKWRYDLISLTILLIASIIGIVPLNQTFIGFGQPPVITIAAVLVVSKGLMNSGIINFFARLISKAGDRYIIQLMALITAVTISSAFTSNIALALFMPVAIRIARKNEKSPSLYLMPLAFGSLLGGLITLVGTPSNIIISNFRAVTLNTEPFRMFDFTRVGVIVALFGITFLLLVGWQLIPKRKVNISQDKLSAINHYITALKVPEDTKIENLTLKEIEKISKENIIVVGYERNNINQPAPSSNTLIRSGDTIIVKGETEYLQEIIDHFGFKLAEIDKLLEENLSSDEIAVIEATVTSNSNIIGKTASSLYLRTRFGINLLGIARQGMRLNESPSQVKFRASDVLLLQGATVTLQEVLPIIGCLPLAERDINIGKNNRVFLGVGIFAFSIIISALNLLPVQIAFVIAAVLMVFSKFLTLKEVYESIDWSIIILLGSIIPITQAFETTGSAQLIANFIINTPYIIPDWITLMLVMIIAMLLSNIVNNAVSALIMAPIALNISLSLGTSIDPFLMAVAIGASCAFLTPIGHQSITLVMGPGGYRFGDYWRLGLPLSILVIVSSIPLILLFWPL